MSINSDDEAKQNSKSPETIESPGTKKQITQPTEIHTLEAEIKEIAAVSLSSARHSELSALPSPNLEKHRLEVENLKW